MCETAYTQCTPFTVGLSVTEGALQRELPKPAKETFRGAQKIKSISWFVAVGSLMTRCNVSAAVNHHALKKDVRCSCPPNSAKKHKRTETPAAGLWFPAVLLWMKTGGGNLSYPCFWAPSWQRQRGSRQIPQLRCCCRLVCHPRWFPWTLRTGRSLDKSNLQAHNWDMYKVCRARLLTPRCQSPGSSGERPVKMKNLTGGLHTRLHSVMI